MEFIIFKVQGDKKRLFKRAAKKAGLSLSAWCRYNLLSVIGHKPERGIMRPGPKLKGKGKRHD